MSFQSTALFIRLIHRGPATASAASATARASPAALPFPQLAKLAAHYKEHKDCQRSDNNNIRHYIHPFRFVVI